MVEPVVIYRESQDEAQESAQHVECDSGSCLEQAEFIVWFESGALYFCGEHYELYESILVGKVVDTIEMTA